jgi:hypothetical protein
MRVLDRHPVTGEAGLDHAAASSRWTAPAGATCVIGASREPGLFGSCHTNFRPTGNFLVLLAGSLFFWRSSSSWGWNASFTLDTWSGSPPTLSKCRERPTDA